MKAELRFSHHPGDVKKYDTSQVRKEFLIEKIFVPGEICFTYTLYDRFIAGGAMPLETPLILLPFSELKADHFLQRREMGIINTGGPGSVKAGGTDYRLNYKEALYLGKDTADISFLSDDPAKPAKFYINSASAHHAYPCRKVTLNDAEVVSAGSAESSNRRTINKLLINNVIETCGLQMGLTSLQPGSVWNTMPPHTHSRRMEVYFYFEVPAKQAVCHFMGEPDETRHIWMHNEQAVISPPWSIHSAAGTSNYSFIWGMAGENLDYSDMDTRQPDELK
ncbi:MAG TPA: 5-dehydro-4-deoxy-D-glucuronate isomerase [Bacteroidales bacterium]|nr:5-dehydro-4-deoxy-D-glucuronate isomerase [Bacteroidales bacterium]